MNVKVAEVMVDLLIKARELQEISASSGQEKQIFELLFTIAHTAHAGMAALASEKRGA
jgi:hypothetical protein